MVPDVPAGVVTVTSTVPTAPGGLVRVIDVPAALTLKLPANSWVPPKLTAVAPVKPIEALGVQSVEVPHHAGKIPLRCAQTDMVVIAHQAICEDFHLPPIMNFSERVEKRFVVSILEENLLPGASTVHHVVNSSGVLDP